MTAVPVLTNASGAPLSFVLVVGGYPPARRGGMENACQRQAEALARRGYPVTVLTVQTDGAAAETMERGVRVLRVMRPLSLGPLFGVTYRRQVRRWLTSLLPHWDVVMCHQLYLHSFETNRVAHANGRRSCHLLVAAQVNNSDVDRFAAIRGGSRLMQSTVHEADTLFVLSGVSRRELEAIGTPPDRIQSYQYFVDTESFTPGPAAPEREFLCIGRWDPGKNLPLLLDAFERFSQEVPGVRLRIVGAGPEEANLRARIERLTHRDRVSLEGWVTDPRELYRRAWAVVTSSDGEGLSNVLIEAMATGTPVITTDVSGAREALDLEDTKVHVVRPGSWLRGTSGLLVPMRDAAALSSAMMEIVQTPELRPVLSEGARERAVAVFSEHASIARFLQNVSRWFPAAAPALASAARVGEVS